MKALLIIDMQKGSFKPYSLRHDTFSIVEKINNLSILFRKNNDKIIFIQHDGTAENCYLPNTEDWEILPELTKEKNDLVVSKTANDAFYQTTLEGILAKDNISELFITGCATDFCVDSTVKTALIKDYNLTIVEDAHTTADRPFLSAEMAIKHYNWLWADMTATKFKIKVIKTNDILKMLDRKYA